MVFLLVIEARNVGLLVGQWIALIAAVVLVAGRASGLSVREDDDEVEAEPAPAVPVPQPEPAVAVAAELASESSTNTN